MPANLENSAVATGLEKVSFHSNPKERQCQRMLKLPHTCTHLFAHASKVMLKILQTMEKEMATHSSIRAWKIPRMEDPGKLQSMGSQRVGHN